MGCWAGWVEVVSCRFTAAGERRFHARGSLRSRMAPRPPRDGKWLVWRAPDRPDSSHLPSLGGEAAQLTPRHRCRPGPLVVARPGRQGGVVRGFLLEHADTYASQPCPGAPAALAQSAERFLVMNRSSSTPQGGSDDAPPVRRGGRCAVCRAVCVPPSLSCSVLRGRAGRPGVARTPHGSPCQCRQLPSYHAFADLAPSRPPGPAPLVTAG